MVHNTTHRPIYPEIIDATDQKNKMVQHGIIFDAEHSLRMPIYDPALIPQLPHMSVQQLNMLESQINQEFSTLAHEYLKARLSRLNSIINHLDANIENSRASDGHWSLFYNLQLQVINELNHITEDLILDGTKFSSKQIIESPHELETRLDSLITSMKLPLEYDELLNGENETLPFKDFFSEIIDYHKVQLSALLKLEAYHSRYMESITEINKTLTWKRCKLDISEYKEELINKTFEELRNLNDEYYSITPLLSLALSDKLYYKSNVPVTSMKEPEPGSQLRLELGNIDPYYDIDNIYYKKNQLEISDTKRAVLAGDKRFKASSNRHPIPQLERVTIKLDGCVGLSAEEAEADLSTLRAHMGMNPGSRTKPINRAKASRIPSKPQTSRPLPESSVSNNDQEYNRLLNLNRMPSRIKFETKFK